MSWRTPNRSEGIETEAATWVARRDAGFRPGEETEFEHWKSSDPQHVGNQGPVRSAEELSDGLTLGFKPKAGAALATRRDAIVGDVRLRHF
jgi:ferric-dicitrate binding protein FerR (iron transport regulator)